MFKLIDFKSKIIHQSSTTLKRPYNKKKFKSWSFGIKLSNFVAIPK